MHEINPEGFDKRAPGSCRIRRTDKFPVGPDERWASDGHEKLLVICGVGIYGFVDDATGRILRMEVLSEVRDSNQVGLVFLDAVIERGGKLR